ncbi:MAG TPA: asparagine synthase-related protein [Nitrososphaerales archaeon]|nr:asparagine synthase-related protein [Nitrososphaerales archaeon]
MSDRPVGLEEAAKGLAGAIQRSVDGSVAGLRRVAVAFSGGLDSSVLVACAKRRARVVACTTYAAGSRDSARAGIAAEELGVEFAPVEVTKEGAEVILSWMDLPFEPTLMDRSLWVVFSAAAQRAEKEGAEAILLGQLADEIFGGYEKYERALQEGEERVSAMMGADVEGFASRGRLRDFRACSRWTPPRFPFEAQEVVSLGQSLPLGLKLMAGERKIVLRRAAELLGVPRDLARAEKKAAQYSSGVQKLLR